MNSKRLQDKSCHPLQKFQGIATFVEHLTSHVLIMENRLLNQFYTQEVFISELVAAV